LFPPDTSWQFLLDCWRWPLSFYPVELPVCWRKRVAWH